MSRFLDFFFGTLFALALAFAIGVSAQAVVDEPVPDLVPSVQLDSRVLAIMASSTLDVATASSIVASASDTKAITDRLDLIISVLNRIYRKQ
jgi:hypothetical protein